MGTRARALFWMGATDAGVAREADRRTVAADLIRPTDLDAIERGGLGLA
jgi:hypothetical protein